MSQTPASVGSQSTLTVVLPNYNHARYLRTAVDALVNQSRPPNRIILIDDHSSDDSVDLIKSLAIDHPIITPVFNEVNVGVVAATNIGLSMADTDYICFAAADDYVLPGYLERAVQALDAYPSVALIWGASQVLTEDGCDVTPPELNPVPVGIMEPKVMLAKLISSGNFVNGNTVMYRRQRLQEVGGFDPALAAFADGFMHMLLGLRYGVARIDGLCGVWWKREEGFATSQSANIEKSERSLNATLNLMRGKYKETFPDVLIDRFEGRWRYGTAISLLKKEKSFDALSFANLSLVKLFIMKLFRFSSVRFQAALLLILMCPADFMAVLSKKITRWVKV